MSILNLQPQTEKLGKWKQRPAEHELRTGSVWSLWAVFSTPHPPSSMLASPKAGKEQMIKAPLILSGLCSDFKVFKNGFYFTNVIIFPFCSFSTFFCAGQRGWTQGGKSIKCLPSRDLQRGVRNQNRAVRMWTVLQSLEVQWDLVKEVRTVLITEHSGERTSRSYSGREGREGGLEWALRMWRVHTMQLDSGGSTAAMGQGRHGRVCVCV